MRFCVKLFFGHFDSQLLLQNPRNLPHSSSIEKGSNNPPSRWRLSEVRFLNRARRIPQEELFDAHVSQAVLLVPENAKHESQQTCVGFGSYSEKPYSSFPTPFLVSPWIQNLVRVLVMYHQSQQISDSNQLLSNPRQPNSVLLLMRFLRFRL
jgi:hypothetical protein